MTPTKQTVYLPEYNEGNLAVCNYKYGDWGHEEDVQPKEGYFFTPEQLNEYTQRVIKQALETAAEQAKIPQFKSRFLTIQENKQSITNTFEETFKKFKV